MRWRGTPDRRTREPGGRRREQDAERLTWRERIRWVRGLLNKRLSHDGKVRYRSRASAEKAKAAMEKKRAPKRFDVYRCFWGRRHYHIGGSVRR